MRSEQAMLELIISRAQNDDRIRAVIMNGSRTNPNARRDIFQDFDIIYVVTKVDPFKDDRSWIDCFGELMILQMPEAMQDPPPQNNGTFVYLMQFSDGNRIDLGLVPIAKLNELACDSLSLLLLDKDGIIEPFAAPSENDYLPKPPTAKLFADCCNEFWWVCPYVAKGLWREEIIYAKTMFDGAVREQMMKMLTWYVSMKTQFTRSPGKLGKHFKQSMEPELWVMLEKTYTDAGYANTWEALYTMCNLFRVTAVRVAVHFGFDYPYRDDEKVSAHLRRVQLLPKDAIEMY